MAGRKRHNPEQIIAKLREAERMQFDGATTNKSIKDWSGIFAGDDAMTAAILDRLLHKSTALNFRGRSYRLQDLERMLK